MELLISPSQTSINKARSLIKVMDQTQNFSSTKATLVSKLAKNIKTVKVPVSRYFDSPAQVSSYYAEGEYDILAIFKMLDYEAYFAKAVQKKIGLFSKSGFAIHCNNDDIKNYLNQRFKLMELQTGKSLRALIKQLAKYCIIGSNAFVVKVRDKNFEHATSYQLNGKEQHPVVGYFLAHPTTMKPRFKYVKDPDTGLPRLELDKWIHINRRGVIKSFELEDVCHFVLNKQEGLVMGCPEIIPVIDDIKVLRKIEEDTQLLIYRDLFPIIHYAIEKPVVLDHMGGMDELTQARNDMQNIIQDGGIATDSRHEIKFIGSEGKGMDVMPMLEYFQQRVFTGLGVSPSDMGMSAAANKSSAENASEQVIDYVKDIQQDIAEQFKQMIITELLLQSPYSMGEIFDSENEVTLKFEEVDIEWKVRTENHEADLFAKGVNTIHETRNKMNKKDITDDELMYTWHGLYNGAEPPTPAMTNTEHGNKYIQKQGELAHATTVPTQTTTTGGGGPSKTTKTRPLTPAKTTKSAAKADPIKSSKTNSNIVKHKDEARLEDQIAIQDHLVKLYETVKDKSDSQKKITMMVGTKILYDNIKSDMIKNIKAGSDLAFNDLGISPRQISITHNLFAPIDKLRDSVIDMVSKDGNTINRASLRVSTAARTEASRAFNYGYAKTLLENGQNKFVICAELDDLTDDSMPHVGKVIEFNEGNLVEQIPPFRPNSRLRVKAYKEPTVEVTDELKVKDEIEQINIDFEKECAKITTSIQTSLDSSLEGLSNKIISKVDGLEDRQVELEGKSSQIVSQVTEIKDSILNSVDNRITLGKDENSKNLERVINLLVDMQQDNKEQTNSLLRNVLKTISDAATKEINIVNPPMEINLSMENKEKANKSVTPVRDETGKIVSYKIEDN